MMGTDSAKCFFPGGNNIRKVENNTFTGLPGFAPQKISMMLQMITSTPVTFEVSIRNNTYTGLNSKYI